MMSFIVEGEGANVPMSARQTNSVHSLVMPYLVISATVTKSIIIEERESILLHYALSYLYDS